MAKLPFHGELMTCCMCDKQQKSDPKVESDWTLITMPEGDSYYVCPDELPLSNRKATKWDFARAYDRIFTHIAELRSAPKP